MKLLLITPLPPPVGGIASWSLNLINYFKKYHNSMDVILVNSAQKDFSFTSESIFRRWYYGISNSMRIYKETRRRIKHVKPSVIHLVSSSSLALLKDFLIVNLARQKKIPIIIHWRFGRIPDLANHNNWEWKILCLIIRKTSKSIIIDTKSYYTLIANGFNNVVYIPNPLSIDIENKARTIDNNTNHRPNGRILYVGHIIRNKGVFELVETCSHLSIINELILIGPYQDDIKKELTEIAGKKGDGSWLRLLGTLSKDQVLDMMHKSPILALPSYTEGFPNVVIEAMAMGCAVVATDVGAIPDILAISGDLPCGICIPPRNTQKLKEAISLLAENPDKALMMGKRGIARVLNNYTIESIVNQYRAVWENTCIE